MKNEGPYLLEWLEFHKLVGAERFYLYDNNSEDNTQELLRPYQETGEAILNNWPPTVAQQMKAYTHCLKNYKTESEWIAFLDLDEFLFPTEKDDIKEILTEFVDFPALGVNWLNFGPSGHKKKPEGLQIENYIRRSQASFSGNKHVKCIVKPEITINAANPHQFLYADERLAVTENRQPLNGPQSEEHSVEKIRINHYTTRSKEESRKKMMRGRPTTQKKRPWSHFEARHKIFDKVEDLTIQKFLPDLKKAMAQPR